MSKQQYPKDFLDLLNSITAKRPATVIKHILDHSFITSQELKDVYGYNHPPRAVRDVREQGIPVETFRVEGNDGRKIAAYRFGDPNDVNRIAKTKGRQAIAKEIKQGLIERYGSRCFIYLEELDEGSLQVDHRVPYEIGGERSADDLDGYMLLCASANRLKSHSCETCTNWTTKDPLMCEKCFWAHPENYSHVAGRLERIVMLSLTDKSDIEAYDKLVSDCGKKEATDLITEQVSYYFESM